MSYTMHKEVKLKNINIIIIIQIHQYISFIINIQIHQYINFIIIIQIHLCLSFIINIQIHQIDDSNLMALKPHFVLSFNIENDCCQQN